MSAGRSGLGLLNKRVHRIPPITVKQTIFIIQNYFYDPLLLVSEGFAREYLLR